MSTLISDIAIILNETTIFSYEYDGKEVHVDYSDLAELFAYATEEDIEGVSVYTDSQLILGFLTVASGQGGLVFALDAATKKIIHVSDGAYTISIAKHRGYLYSLCYIENYVTKGHFGLFRCQFGTIQPSREISEVTFDCSCDYSSYDGKIGSLNLASTEEGLFIKDKVGISPVIIVG